MCLYGKNSHSGVQFDGPHNATFPVLRVGRYVAKSMWACDSGMRQYDRYGTGLGEPMIGKMQPASCKLHLR